MANPLPIMIQEKANGKVRKRKALIHLFLATEITEY